MASLLLLAAVAFNLYHLYPEVALRVPNLNDGVLHLLGVQRATTALFLGQDPTDPWLAPIAQGYPFFHDYQHLPYLPLAALYLLSKGRLPLDGIFNWTRYLLLSLFPLSLYWSMRRLGFSRLAAAPGGLVACLLATNGLYGFDFTSYVWSGYGMYTQLWGMLLLPPALAQGYAALRQGRGYFWAVLLLAATLLCHVVLGYIALVSLAVFAALGAVGRGVYGAPVGRTENSAIYPLPNPPPQGGESDSAYPDRQEGWGVRLQCLKRLALLLVLAALVTAYFWVPFWLDSAYRNRSVWEEAGKYDAYGYQWVLGALVRGELFDFGRLPVLTLLAALGLAVCLWRWQEERYRLPVALLAVWLLLYFGRPTWGVLLDLLPLSRDLHLHRLIAGVHLAGILLMGLGLALPWEWALSRRKARYLLAPAALTALLLAPVYKERAVYLQQNARWMAESQVAIAAEAGEFQALTDKLRALPPGRVYAGLAGSWGRDYRIGAVPVYALLQGEGFDMLGYLYHALSLNADVQVLFHDGLWEQYNLFNVRYVVVPVDWTVPKYYQPIKDFGRHRLYEVPTTGYFDLVGSDLVFFGGKGDWYPAASRWLKSDLPRLKQHPVVLFSGPAGEYRQFSPLSQAGDVIAQASFPSEPARGSVLSEAVESNGYRAEVQVARESMLMLKATYHPNWRATVDGVEARTVMLMPSYVGVKITPGTHLVRLEYQPGPLRGILQIVGVLTLVLIGVAEWRREKLAGLARLTPGLEQLLPRLPSWRFGLAACVRRAGWERLAPHLPYLGGLAVLTLLVGLPLFQFKEMRGHDALEYLPRAVEFYEGLRAGQLFPRWAPDLSAGYGQPFFNFNPPLFYYLSAVFHALGFSFLSAQNLACFALLGLAGLGMYLLAGEFFGRRGGLVSAAGYLLAPYLLVTLYVRHALADFSAFAFIPLAFWGLYRFVKEGRYPSLLVGALSVALLLLSSNPVALMTLPAFLLWLGVLAGVERSWRTLLRGLECLGLGLGLATFFWLPALAERDLVQTARLLEGYLNYRNHFVYLRQFFVSPWGYGLSLPGPNDEMSLAVGPVHLALAGAALVLLWRLRRVAGRAGRLAWFFLVLLVLAAFFASTASRLLWERLPLLQLLEFPWRFLSLVAVSTAFLCGFSFLFLRPQDRRLADGLLAALVAALFLSGFPHARPEGFLAATDADYTPWTIAARDIAVTTANEYEPIWVKERPQAPAGERLTLVEGQGYTSPVWLSPTAYEFRVTVTQQAWLRVNTFYFPGWTLSVDGAERPLTISSPQGLMEFPLEPGEHLVHLRFADTPVRRWSTRLSLLALFLLLLPPFLARIAPSRAAPTRDG